MPYTYYADATAPEANNPIAFNSNAMKEWIHTAREAVKGDAQNPTPTGWTKLSDMMSGKGLFMLNDKLDTITFVNPDFMGNPEQAMQQMKEVMQASADGRLYMRNSKDGMLMQLKTAQNPDQSYNLTMSVEMNFHSGSDYEVRYFHSDSRHHHTSDLPLFLRESGNSGCCRCDQVDPDLAGSVCCRWLPVLRSGQTGQEKAEGIANEEPRDVEKSRGFCMGFA